MNIIKNAEHLPLGDDDVLRICEGKAKVITYPEIANFRSIDQLLEPHDAVLLLYMTGKNYGHWCSLFRRSDSVLEFFDSYGKAPDEQLAYCDPSYNGNNEPFLTKLIYTSPYQCQYNDYCFQAKGNMSTCGRYASLRIAFRNYSLPEVAKLFCTRSISSPDDIVTLLTSFI